MSDDTGLQPLHIVEGFARIVRVEDGMALLEPEQTGGCAGCASAAACNEKGIGTLANRLEARRFAIPNDTALRAGDRVVLGIRPHSLVAASATVYLIPLLTALGCAALMQWWLGSDVGSLLGMVLGLLLGLGLMRVASGRMTRGGKNEFQIIRLARASEHCR